jgi:hypothetical protein
MTIDKRKQELLRKIRETEARIEELQRDIEKEDTYLLADRRHAYPLTMGEKDEPD